MKCLNTILLIILNFSLHAQLQRNYTSYTVENGLAQNTVWDVIQDCKGYLWIGTADGINKFDGYQMTHYKKRLNDTSSLGGTSGFNFYEDSLQQLWIGHDKGVSIYDRVHNSFLNIYLSETSVSIVGEDEHHLLWVIIGGYLLAGFDKTTHQLVHKIPFDGIRNDSYGSIMSSVRLGNDYFLTLGNRKTVHFKPNILSAKLIKTNANTKPTLIKLNESSFCCFNPGFVFRYTFQNNILTCDTLYYTEPEAKLFSFSGAAVIGKKLYAASVSGLFVFDAKTLKFEEHIKNFSKQLNESYFYIQTVRTDRSNNIYIATNGGGLHILSPFRNKFKHYTTYSSAKNLFKSITTLPNGNIIGGVYSEGLIFFNKDGTFTQQKLNGPGNPSSVLGIYELSPQYLLIANNHDIVKYDIGLHKVVSTIKTPGYDFIAYPYFNNIHHQLLVNKLSANNRSVLADATTGKIVYFFPDYSINVYQYLTDSTLIIGTSQGLILYNVLSKRIQKTAITDFIKTIYITQQKRIFIGGISGLFEITASGKIVHHYNVTNYLPDDFIYGILEDTHHNLWFSHNKGISRFNYQTNTFTHFGVKDGLQSNEFNSGAFYKDKQGLLYFGGVNGINVINPEHIIQNPHVPQVGINEILLGDIPYKNDTSYNELTTLNLTYLENTLSFDFSALEFSQPEQNTYAYKLEGYDNNWIESGTRHFARYANLPPGNYIFKIKAANGDGKWNEQVRELFIYIKPPFWQTNWFYTLLIVIALVSVLGVVYVVTNRQKLRLQRELEIQQKLERERLRISRDLHDNVGAQLSFLITNVEWMLEHPDQLSEVEEKQRLQALSEAGRNAILTLRQTIWAISNSSLSIEDFADRFKQFALKMMEFNQSVHLHFTEHIPVEKTLSPAVALNLFRVCQEAFNNCLKHAHCTNITIYFTSNTTTQFECKIVDDGIGFDWDEAQRKGHYGLINMKARAEESGAELFIQSEKGKGTQLIVSLK